jgi:hypothetical protein
LAPELGAELEQAHSEDHAEADQLNAEWCQRQCKTDLPLQLKIDPPFAKRT